MKYQKPRGTVDTLPNESYKQYALEKILRQIMDLYNYKEIMTPIFEYYNLFARTVGEYSDIVEKEMFIFNDRKDRTLALRPEATVGVARAITENNLDITSSLPIKLFYYGPMFRYERPQNGRQRQFYQFGVEAFGTTNYLLDVEIIALAVTILKKLNLKNYTLKINSLGKQASRHHYKKILKEKLLKIKATLCFDCQRRIDKNPLRVLDCKIDTNIKDLPKIINYLSDEEKTNFKNIENMLLELDIKYEIDHKLVRGLDYYNDLIFEIEDANHLTLIAGGRYDQLISELDQKKNLPAIGFALGIERLILTLKENNCIWFYPKKIDVYLICLTTASRIFASWLIYHLRINGISADIDYLNSPKQFKNLDKIKCHYAIIIGDNELKNKTLIIKDQRDLSQKEIEVNNIIAYIKEKKGHK